MKNTIITIILLFSSVILIFLYSQKQNEIRSKSGYTFICKYEDKIMNKTTNFEVKVKTNQTFEVLEASSKKILNYEIIDDYRVEKNTLDIFSKDYNISYNDKKQEIIMELKNKLYEKDTSTIWYKDFIKEYLDEQYQCERIDN